MGFPDKPYDDFQNADLSSARLPCARSDGHARRGRVRPIGNLAAARLRHIAGTAWSTKRCLNIQLLGATRREPPVSATARAPLSQDQKCLAPPKCRCTPPDQFERLVIPVKLVTGYRQVSMASQFHCQSEGTRLPNPACRSSSFSSDWRILALCREHKAPVWRFRENHPRH